MLPPGYIKHAIELARYKVSYLLLLPFMHTGTDDISYLKLFRLRSKIRAMTVFPSITLHIVPRCIFFV
jgi:hypothetical protein